MSIKKLDGTIELILGEYQKDLFTRFVKNHADDIVFVSMIPFVRNLVEAASIQTAEWAKLLKRHCLDLPVIHLIGIYRKVNAL